MDSFLASKLALGLYISEVDKESKSDIIGAEFSNHCRRTLDKLNKFNQDIIE